MSVSGGISFQSSSTPPTVANAAVTRLASSAAGTTAAGLASVSITNVGAANGVAGGVPLLPGETVTFEAYLDPVANVFNRIPAVAYDGTGTVLHVTTQA